MRCCGERHFRVPIGGRGAAGRVSAHSRLGWSSLSLLRDTLYMIGVHGPEGRRDPPLATAEDWTYPGTPERGLLVPGDSAIACIAGRALLCTAAASGVPWSGRYSTSVGSFSSFVISAPPMPTSWMRQLDCLDGLLHPRKDVPGTTWLEGNVLSLPDGNRDVLRCHSDTDNVACVLSVSRTGRRSAGSEIPSIPLPGACKKFTIRYDTRSRRYWSIVNYPLPRYRE